MALIAGLFEPSLALGDTVTAGQTVGHVHSLEEIDRPPVAVVSHAEGVLYQRRGPAVVARGDYVFTVAQEMSREEVLALLPT